MKVKGLVAVIIACVLTLFYAQLCQPLHRQVLP